MRFLSRRNAGRELATALRPFAKSGTIIFALPRSGFVVATEVARILQLPLDLILVRKIGHPTNLGFASGAIAEGGKPVYDDSEVQTLDEEWRESAEKCARRIIVTRRKLYFNAELTHPNATSSPAIVIDDGMATGLTMLAAVTALSAQHPSQIIAAVPVASRTSIDLLKDHNDKCIVLGDPDTFGDTVGMHYVSFPQVDDITVKSLLERSNKNESKIRQTTTINPKA